MSSLSTTRAKVPYLQLNVRRNTFLEASAGYSEEEARGEARRCAGCQDAPCAAACPMGADVPSFISAAAEGDFLKAYDAVSEANPLAAICSRVCADAPRCEGACAKARGEKAVAISALERFVCDFARREGKNRPFRRGKGERRGSVAVVGAGFSGLSCAGALANKGYEVTVFEDRKEPGSCLLDVIPEFKLPREAVSQSLDALGGMGVKIVAGDLPRPEDLLARGFDAVYVSGMCPAAASLELPGGDLKGVVPAEVFLWRVRMSGKYRDAEVGVGDRVIVVGEGDMAVDAARCARRLAARATVLCRCRPEEMAAGEDAVRAAREEGVEFEFLCEAAEIDGDERGRVAAVCCRKLMSVRSARAGETLLIPVEDGNFELEAEYVIAAGGPARGNYVETALRVESSERTAKPGCFRFSGTAAAVEAAAAGAMAAGEIERFIGKVN